MLQKDKIATGVIAVSFAVAIGHFMQHSSAEAAFIDPRTVHSQALTLPSTPSVPQPPAVLIAGLTEALSPVSDPLHLALASPVAPPTPSLTDEVHIPHNATCDRINSVAGPDGTSCASHRHQPFGRVALIWSGDLPLNLHIFENGATFGEPGHIWSESQSSKRGAISESFFIELGDGEGGDLIHSQVYSYRVQPQMWAQEPQIMIEAAITASTCSHDIAAQLVYSDGSHTSRTIPVSIAMPECGSGDGFIQLKNPLEDLTLAQN
ncbi:hypothetical protein [Celeribacter sp.]|uniref:hypothetical protein n=1 Tax=Celeribacter sp. TaxID=1890673 RepID=UPI003A9485A5